MVDRFRRRARTPAAALFRRVFVINGLVFTLGTLAVILVFGLIGYALAADVRAKSVTVPLDTGLEPASGD